MDGKLGRGFKELSGTRQGHVKASGHFKAYINPCLDALDSTDLGFHIGPICVNSVCCADDTYVLSDRQSGLQSAMDIVSHVYDLTINVQYMAYKQHDGNAEATYLDIHIQTLNIVHYVILSTSEDA